MFPISRVITDSGISNQFVHYAIHILIRGETPLNCLIRLYCKLLDALTAALLLIMVVLVFGNVVLRYGFNSGWTVSEEVARWAFIWVVFLGAIAAMHLSLIHI